MEKKINKKILGALFLSLAASIWGGMYVVVKVVVEIFPPFELVWMRYFIAAIALLIIALIMKQSLKIARRDWGILFLVALIGNTISIVTQEIRTMFSTAKMGAIITATTPAFMVILSRLILKESITIKKSISIVLATVGVFIMVGVDTTGETTQLGGIFLLIAALT